MRWRSAPLSGNCCSRYPRRAWELGTVFSRSLPTAVLPPAPCDAQTQKAANLRPDSLSSLRLCLTLPDIVMCQSRTSLRRNKCGDPSVKPLGLTGVTL